MSDYEFGSVHSAITGQDALELHPTGYPRELWTPDVVNDPDGDVEIQAEGWSVITGKTGQYGYNGAVMHPSENASDETIRGWVREAGGDWFAIVEVRGDDGTYPDGDPIGWAIVYREAAEGAWEFDTISRALRAHEAGLITADETAGEIRKALNDYDAKACDWFVNNATERAWCCNTHMFDGTGDLPMATGHPVRCPFSGQDV